MTLQEIREATLARVIEITLEEYATACETMPHRNYYGEGYNYHPDKTGYINQVLD